AGADNLPVAASAPAPATVFRSVLRSMAWSPSCAGQSLRFAPPLPILLDASPGVEGRRNKRPVCRSLGASSMPEGMAAAEEDAHQIVLTGCDCFGCHHRPAITTPCEEILRSPVRCSPTTST